MAIEEMRSAEATGVQSDLIRRIGEIEERLDQLRTAGPDAPRFDSIFWKDLGVGLGLFVLATICLALQVPVLGDPLALLVGPIVTVFLSWKHRP